MDPPHPWTKPGKTVIAGFQIKAKLPKICCNFDIKLSHIYIYIYINTYIHTYIHIHTYTYIHTHIYFEQKNFA